MLCGAVGCTHSDPPLIVMQTLLQLAKRLVPRQSIRNHIRLAGSSLRSIAEQIFLELRFRGRFRRVERTGLLLNIGCGPMVQPGWINIDKTIYPNSYYADLSDKLRLDDRVAKHIHCEHFLEHLEYYYAKRFLAECFRVLEKGGSIRLIVPDAEKYLRAYCANDTEYFEKLKHLGGAPQPFRSRMEIINEMVRMGGAHQFAWDFETLSMILKEIGFAGVERSNMNDIEGIFDIDGKDAWRSLESLYVNARKHG